MAADSSDKEGYTPLTDFKTKKGFLGGTERVNVPAMVQQMPTELIGLSREPRSHVRTSKCEEGVFIAF